MIGRDLDRSYRLEAQLSAGWLAVTHRARRLEYGSIVAIKHFHAALDHKPLQSIDAELSAWDALRHPNVNAIVDRGVHEGRPWIASRWLEGETLAARITGGPLQLSAAVTTLRPLLAALASAHAAGLAHRNLKPSNVIFEVPSSHGRERVQLLDAIPTAVAAVGGRLPPRSPYIAPELMAGQPGTARGDVFAAGMLALAMLNGADVESDASVETTTEPARSVAGVSGGLTAWIRGATASEPSQRFCDAGEMLAELVACMPRELRSGRTASDGPKRIAPSSPPPKPTRVSSERPAPSQRMAALPPATAHATSSVNLPPPQRIPLEARSRSDVEAPHARETPTAPASAQSVRDESGQSVRPIEALASPRRIAAQSRLWIAAGVIGVVVIAGLAFIPFMQSAPRARVSERNIAQPTPMSAPVVLDTPPAPLGIATGAKPPANDAPPTVTTATLVAAPGHPAIRDPWSDPMLPALKRLHDSANKGALADEAKVTALLDYNREHREDARGYLVIGQLYLNRHWRTDCVEQWTTALQLDPGVRGAPEVLPGLLEIVAQGKAAAAAQALVLKFYGTEAVEAIQNARDSAQSEGGVNRLHNLYLKLADSAPPKL